MKVTIETIGGKKYTVVWHKNVSDNLSNEWKWTATSIGLAIGGEKESYATALPPLPCKPKPEDAKLLYRYMAEGLTIEGSILDYCIEKFEATLHVLKNKLIAVIGVREQHVVRNKQFEITHCIDEQGEKVEVAIDG